MELHELHVLDDALGAIDHRDAVARGDVGIRGGGIDSPRAAGGHQRDARQERVNLLCVGVEDIGAVALDVRHVAVHLASQMVLRDDLHGEMVLQHRDTLVAAHGTDESLLDLVARVIGVMQDAELAVAALAVQVELAILVLVEVHAPFHQVSNALGRVPHHLLHGCGVADEVAGHHRVLDMLLEVIYFQVRDRGHATLCLVRISLINRCLTDECHLAFSTLRHLERIAHPGYTRADNEKVEFTNHR